MEELARSRNTPATDAAFDLLARIAPNPEYDDRYPNGTALIPSDSPDAPTLISRAVDKGRPVAIVFPDGSDVVARPPSASRPARLVGAGLLWLADRLGRRRDRSSFIPRDWATEFHLAHKSHEPTIAG